MKRNKTFGLVIEFSDKVDYFLKFLQGWVGLEVNSFAFQPKADRNDSVASFHSQ
jgi:hypothetical protein